jgi:phosphoglycerate dehydrogenase-like enzyme
MHLFVYSALDNAARTQLLAKLPKDVEAVFRTDLPEPEQRTAFQSADLLMGNPPAAWFTEHAPEKLQFWQIDSAGFERYKQVQVSCPVANIGDYFAWPCAETIVAGILALYRHIDELAVLQTQKQWAYAAVRKTLQLLGGKRVIILGAGAIGLAVQEQLSGFRCQVQLLARSNPKAQLHFKEELLTALPDTDLVINCLPGSADKFFSADLIATLPPHAVYASVGRGNTTDESALIAALQANHLSGAVLDVTAQEPLPAESPLWTLPNVLLTQHTAGGQPHEDEGKAAQLLRNLELLRSGQELENRVELARGY